jgi:hypothetical protein
MVSPGYVPHPTMPVGHLRPNDIMLLLSFGAILEFTTRVFLLLFIKRKPSSTKKREVALKALSRRVKKSCALGPPAFVETSKLERQEMAEEKALAELAEKRRKTTEKWQKHVKNAFMVLNLIIFLIHYGIPMMEFSGHRIAPEEILTPMESQEAAISTFEACLFPLSYVGIGIKVSKWGMVNPRASTGALLVFWSAQVTVGQIMDGIDALCL